MHVVCSKKKCTVSTLVGMLIHCIYMTYTRGVCEWSCVADSSSNNKSPRRDLTQTFIPPPLRTHPVYTYMYMGVMVVRVMVIHWEQMLGCAGIVLMACVIHV